MQTRTILQVLAAAVGLAKSTPAPRIRTGPPRGEIPHSLNHPVAATDQAVELLIGLHPENRKEFERTLHEISDPHHERYGRHLTRQEAKDLLQPPAEASDSVNRWLLEDGDGEIHVDDHGQWIRVRVPSDATGDLAERISHLPYIYSGTGGFLKALAVPDHVRGYISAIEVNRSPSETGLEKEKRSGTGTFDAAPRSPGDGKGKQGGSEDDVDLERCKDVLTPACIRKIYRIMDDPPAKPHPGTLFGVPGFGGQTAQYTELETFIARFAPYATGGNFSVDLVNGGENPQGNDYPSGEANLDIQYAIAMAYNVSVQYMPVGGEYRDFIPDLDVPASSGLADSYLELAAHLLDLPDQRLPQVISISYGTNEQVLDESYARTVCDTFGQLGTRGVSIIAAAGNLGPGVSCLANDGSNSTRFLPGFPASCPYVTAIGATEGNSPEVATNFSSGGFSLYFDRPAWQKDAVGAYLDAHGEEWEGYYNRDGRGYPDVAALGWGHQTMNHGVVETTGGTSAAAPVFAAMIALINNERFWQGKPPMGFLNPWIYSIGDSGFTDITEGRSVGCGGKSVAGLPSPVIPNAGWSAVKGWDPITGFGTPVFDRLKKLAGV